MCNAKARITTAVKIPKLRKIKVNGKRSQQKKRGLLLSLMTQVGTYKNSKKQLHWTMKSWKWWSNWSNQRVEHWKIHKWYMYKSKSKTFYINVKITYFGSLPKRFWINLSYSDPFVFNKIVFIFYAPYSSTKSKDGARGNTKATTFSKLVGWKTAGLP